MMNNTLHQLTLQLEKIVITINHQAPKRVVESLKREFSNLKPILESLQQEIADKTESVSSPVCFPQEVSDTLRETWQHYKHYLSEQHEFTLKSIAEQERFSHLWLISECNNDKACSILSWFIRDGRYKCLFNPFENQTTKKADKHIDTQLDEISRQL